MNEVAVHNGRRFLGHVTTREGERRCEAYDAAGQTLGVFTSPQKAAAAVCEADRERQREAVA